MKMNDYDYNYYNLSTCFQLKKKDLPLQNKCVSHFLRNNVFLSLLWPSFDHYLSQNLFRRGDLHNFRDILNLLL